MSIPPDDSPVPSRAPTPQTPVATQAPPLHDVSPMHVDVDTRVSQSFPNPSPTHMDMDVCPLPSLPAPPSSPTPVPTTSDAITMDPTSNDEQLIAGSSLALGDTMEDAMEDAMEDGELPMDATGPVVAVGVWFRIEFVGVTAEVNVKALFECFRNEGLLGVRVRKKGGKGAARSKKKVMFSFKSVEKRDRILSRMRDFPAERPWAFDEVIAVPANNQEALSSFRYVLHPEYVEMSFLHQQSTEDLAMMLLRAPPCRDIGDLRELHEFPLPPGETSIRSFLRYCLLELNRFPPVCSDSAIAGGPRVLDRVEFTSTWLLSTLDSVYGVARRRLVQFVRGHIDRSNQNSVAFWLPLYVTNGPYDSLIREVAQQAVIAATAGNPDVKYSKPSRPRHLESIGYLESKLWYIDWDSSSPAPCLFLRTGQPLFGGSK